MGSIMGLVSLFQFREKQIVSHTVEASIQIVSHIVGTIVNHTVEKVFIPIVNNIMEKVFSGF